MLDVNLRRERLSNLEKCAIERYTDEIDYSSEIDLCDVIVEHLVAGDFNEDFISEYLNDKNRESIMNLVNEYSGLCFYEQDHENWTDSISSANIDDYRMMLSAILENYNFLIKAATVGGKDMLNELTNYVNCVGYNESSVVDYLRVGFNRDDEVIIHILNEMINDEKYKEFSNEQKAYLLGHPAGVLYEYNGDDVKYYSPEEIVGNIDSYMQGIEYYGDDEFMSNAVSLTNMLNGIPDFEDAVSKINYDHLMSSENISIGNKELLEMMTENNNYISEEKHKNKLN